MILPLMIFLAPLAYSPGPGNLFFAAAAARLGLRATLLALAGYHIATLIITLAIGMGGFAALAQRPMAFEIIKTTGAAYVLWLAWRFFRATPIERDQPQSTVRFSDGVWLLLLNPKAYVIISLMFSQFLSLDAEHRWHEIWIISLVFTLNNLLAFTVWLLAGTQLRRIFCHSVQARGINTAFACLLVGIAIWMFYG
ncbi:LysE family translocator [Rhodobacteraceae bacterium R_SAG7]|nr:LysE family translocator [Rhodobacteraceae bacterium R_SAG7]